MPAPPITFDATLYDALIFDCDGTLADTMPLHYRAWNETLNRRLGRVSDFTEEQFYRYGGIPAREILDLLNQQFGYGFNAEEVALEKETCFLHSLAGVESIPEVVAVIKSLSSNKKMAVASGGLTSIVRETLERIGLTLGSEGEIKFVIGADQVKHGKPAPDLFLRAAELLEVEPTRCLVFEDADPGFAAARAAGMSFIDVRPFRSNLHPAAIY